MKRNLGFGFCVGLCAFFGLFSATQVHTQVQPNAVPGELIIRVKKQAQDSGPRGASSLSVTDLEGLLGRGTINSTEPFQTDPALQRITLNAGKDVHEAIRIFKADSRIELAEPNYIYRISVPSRMDDGVPNDPDFGKLWGLFNTGQKDRDDELGKPGKEGADIHVVPAWKEGIRGSRDILVAVIDTGVLWDHPDLADNIYTNPGEAGDLAANGVDDDKNGFIDDVHGWNFNAKTRDSNDDHSHGTHCAGTIGATGNNGAGVVGVNWKVSILPVKFLGADGGGTLEGAIESVNYARAMGVRVMSNSWGGGSFSQALEDAVRAARDAGILFVAAAGNEAANGDLSPSYPAGFNVENVVSVAALDNMGALTDFSNYGKKSVHVAAPGKNILSTVVKNRLNPEIKYDTFSGTSMAAPHVSGIAALMLSHDKGLSFTELKNRLITTSARNRALRSKIMAQGSVDAIAAINNKVPENDDPNPDLWVDHPFELESIHPYTADMDQVFEVSVPGVSYLRVVFDRIDVEMRFDSIRLEEPSGSVLEELTGTHENYVTEYIKGDKLGIRLKSDSIVHSYGFKISKVQVIK